MLYAYLDDSGTHAASPICVLAGYFGGEIHWTKFDREWHKALEHNGLEEFHANRFWSYVKGEQIPEYKGWDRQRASRFIGTLLRIITSHRVYPVGSAVVMSEWRALPTDERAVLTGAAYRDGKVSTPGAPKKTYYLPFATVIQVAARYCQQGLQMHFVFDQSDYLSGYALDYFNTIKSIQGQTTAKLGDIRFVDSKRNTPIQAADLLAYEVNRYMRERLAKGLSVKLDPNSVLRRAIKKIRNLKRDFRLFDTHSMDIVLRRFREQKKAATENDS